MEQEFHPIAVKREPSEEYLLILPPAEDEPGSQLEEDVSSMQGQVEECQASPSRAGIMEFEVEQELVDVKKEPAVENLFILPSVSNHKPAPQAQASKVVKCETCEKKFSTNRSLMRHQMQHKHGDYATATDKTFKCDICDYSASTKGNLKQHIERAHLLRKLVEDSKSRDDFGDFELRDKLQLKHGSSATSSEKKFKCGKCGKSFVTQRTLNQHKKQVHSEATFECEICSKAFKTKFILKQHKAQVHSKVCCSVCDKKIGQLYMKSHMKLHLRGSFECDLCTYKSKQKSWLSNHIKNKHRSGASETKKRSSRYA